MPNRNNSIALLPTSGIVDPHVRNYLDRLSQAWSQRNQGDDRFITAGEFRGLANQAVLDLFSGGTTGGADGGTGPTNSQLIDNLAQSILGTILYQKLSEQIVLPDLNALRQYVDGVLQNSASGIDYETTTRVTQDMALASAINRIWAYVGGSTAVIDDGALAAATPTSATADKWTTVVSAVTDPNTGLVNATSIKQDLNTYANSANGTFNAIYTVRAAVTVGGQTVAGGFGLSATSGAGSAGGPTIDFGVLANKFWIGAPSSGYNPATDYTTNTQFPFIVVTTPTTINGVTYPAGVYMKNVCIGSAAIDTANMKDASITNAKIGSYIASSNFNGTITGGSITANGTTGWAIDKAGNAVFNNIKVRGDVEATSLNGVNIVGTTNITSGAISEGYLTSTASGTTCSLSVSVPSGCAGVLVTVSYGFSYTGGSGKDAPAANNPNPGYFTVAGNDYHTNTYLYLSPPAGTYTLSATRTIGLSTTGMYMTAQVFKR